MPGYLPGYLGGDIRTISHHLLALYIEKIKKMLTYHPNLSSNRKESTISLGLLGSYG